MVKKKQSAAKKASKMAIPQKAVKKTVKKKTRKAPSASKVIKKAKAAKAASKAQLLKGAKRAVPVKTRKEVTDRGWLITFEGSEGSGKSTQIEHVADRLEEAGFDVVVTREPGGTELGEEIRHLLMHAAAGEEMTPETELLLFAASRAQLVRELILPSLEAGKVILCDRFLDSTTVYQGVGRQIAAEPVHLINNFAVGNLVPDLTVVIDIPTELGLSRIRHRATGLPDRMESETVDFYRKVREGYLLLAKAMPERFVVVDGSRPEKKVEVEIWHAIKERFT